MKNIAIPNTIKISVGINNVTFIQANTAIGPLTTKIITNPVLFFEKFRKFIIGESKGQGCIQYFRKVVNNFDDQNTQRNFVYIMQTIVTYQKLKNNTNQDKKTKTKYVFIGRAREFPVNSFTKYVCYVRRDNSIVRFKKVAADSERAYRWDVYR